MQRVLVEMSDEIVAAIDECRGRIPRGPWIEQQLAGLRAVKQAAERVGVVIPPRPSDQRGGDRKSKDRVLNNGQ